MKKSELKKIIRECMGEYINENGWVNNKDDENKPDHTHVRHGEIYKLKGGGFRHYLHPNDDKSTVHSTLDSAIKSAKKRFSNTNEGLMRNRRTLVSKKPKAGDSFNSGIKKSQRRNDRGIEKDGQVGFANKRLRSMDHHMSTTDSSGGKIRGRK